MERYLREVLGSSTFEGVHHVRSKTMGAVRGKGNKTTELVFRMALVRAGVKGWVLHPAGIVGKPDFYFPRTKKAVFIDGCFWHGCARCGHTPKTRSVFWAAKFARNQQRDKRTTRTLRKQGIQVVRLWEHQMKSQHGIEKAVQQLQRPAKKRRQT